MFSIATAASRDEDAMIMTKMLLDTADKYFPTYTCDTRLQAVLTHFLMNI